MNRKEVKGLSFAEIIQTIGLQRKTGVLQVEAGDRTYFLFIEKGKLVGADVYPKRLDERLGQLLLNQGLINEEALHRAINLQKRSNQKLGKILVQEGLISPEILNQTLKRQVMRIFFQLYTSEQEKKFTFEAMDTIDKNNWIINPISIDQLLLETATLIDEFPEIKKEIPDTNIIFAPDPFLDQKSLEIVPPSEGEFLPDTPHKITSIEFHILKLVNGKNTVERILDISPYNDFQTYKALWSLKKKGLIQPIGIKEKAAEVAEVKEEEGSLLVRILSVLGLILVLFSLYLNLHRPFRFLLWNLSSFWK